MSLASASASSAAGPAPAPVALLPSAPTPAFSATAPPALSFLRAAQKPSARALADAGGDMLDFLGSTSTSAATDADGGSAGDGAGAGYKKPVKAAARLARRAPLAGAAPRPSASASASATVSATNAITTTAAKRSDVLGDDLTPGERAYLALAAQPPLPASSAVAATESSAADAAAPQLPPLPQPLSRLLPALPAALFAPTTAAAAAAAAHGPGAASVPLASALSVTPNQFIAASAASSRHGGMSHSSDGSGSGLWQAPLVTQQQIAGSKRYSQSNKGFDINDGTMYFNSAFPDTSSALTRQQLQQQQRFAADYPTAHAFATAAAGSLTALTLGDWEAAIARYAPRGTASGLTSGAGGLASAATLEVLNPDDPEYSHRNSSVDSGSQRQGAGRRALNSHAAAAAGNGDNAAMGAAIGLGVSACLRFPHNNTVSAAATSAGSLISADAGAGGSAGGLGGATGSGWGGSVLRPPTATDLLADSCSQVSQAQRQRAQALMLLDARNLDDEHHLQQQHTHALFGAQSNNGSYATSDDFYYSDDDDDAEPATSAQSQQQRKSAAAAAAAAAAAKAPLFGAQVSASVAASTAAASQLPFRASHAVAAAVAATQPRGLSAAVTRAVQRLGRNRALAHGLWGPLLRRLLAPAPARVALRLPVTIDAGDGRVVRDSVFRAILAYGATGNIAAAAAAAAAASSSSATAAVLKDPSDMLLLLSADSDSAGASRARPDALRHSDPALRLSAVWFKPDLSYDELLNWHRPQLAVDLLSRPPLPGAEPTDSDSGCDADAEPPAGAVSDTPTAAAARDVLNRSILDAAAAAGAWLPPPPARALPAAGREPSKLQRLWLQLRQDERRRLRRMRRRVRSVRSSPFAFPAVSPALRCELAQRRPLAAPLARPQHAQPLFPGIPLRLEEDTALAAAPAGWLLRLQKAPALSPAAAGAFLARTAASGYNSSNSNSVTGGGVDRHGLVPKAVVDVFIDVAVDNAKSTAGGGGGGGGAAGDGSVLSLLSGGGGGGSGGADSGGGPIPPEPAVPPPRPHVSDVSAATGALVLLEHLDRAPLLLANPGMAAKAVLYYADPCAAADPAVKAAAAAAAGLNPGTRQEKAPEYC